MYVLFLYLILFYRGRLVPLDSWDKFLARLVRATAAAYGVGGLFLMLVPIGILAATLAYEHQRGTMEGLLLTSQDGSRLARARFWCLFFPWVRFILYLLPLQVILSGARIDAIVRYNGVATDSFWQGAIPFVFAPGPVAAACESTAAKWLGDRFAFTGKGLLLVLLRLISEFSVLWLAAGLAYYISAKCRTVGRALVIGYLVVVGVLFTVAYPGWWFFAAVIESGMMRGDGALTNATFMFYGFLGTAAMLLRFLAGGWMLWRVARNFDHYALGEKPEPTGLATAQM